MYIRPAALYTECMRGLRKVPPARVTIPGVSR